VEREVDGVKLDRLASGMVRDVSPSLASWLIVEGYAEPEMRRDLSGDREVFGTSETRHVAHERRRRRRKV